MPLEDFGIISGGHASGTILSEGRTEVINLIPEELLAIKQKKEAFMHPKLAELFDLMTQNTKKGAYEFAMVNLKPYGPFTDGGAVLCRGSREGFMHLHACMAKMQEIVADKDISGAAVTLLSRAPMRPPVDIGMYGNGAPFRDFFTEHDALGFGPRLCLALDERTAVELQNLAADSVEYEMEDYAVTIGEGKYFYEAHDIEEGRVSASFRDAEMMLMMNT